MTGAVLVDATVLTNFALVSRQDLPGRLWPEAACSTSDALREYQVGAASGLLPGDAWSELAIVALSDEETLFAAELPPKLGAGERTCLAVALHRRGLLVTDDRDARLIARAYDIPTTGTIGILVQGVRRGLLALEQANGLLSEMIAAGYRSPVTSLEALV